MANKDIDRLFREGLDQIEVTPAPASWEKVQSQFAGKSNKGGMVMKVAAAVIIVIAATFTVLQFSGDKETGKMIVSVDHPNQLQHMELDWNIEINLSRQVENQKQPASKEKSTRPKQEIEHRPHRFETMTISSITAYHFDSELKTNLMIPGMKVKEFDEPTVKITYIASNEPEAKSPKLGQFINYLSSDLSPTDLLADIRDVKDNLFSKNQ